MVPRMAAEPYAPLYPFALKAWMAVFGDGAAALRAFSAAAGLGVVALTWAWAREAVGRFAAVVAAGIVGLSPVLLSESRDVRMYALETFSATLAWWLLWRLVARREELSGWRRVGTVALAAGAVAAELWTMPTGIVIVALQALAVGVAGMGKGRHALPAGTALVLGMLAYAPWVGATIGTAMSGAAYWTNRPSLASIPDTLTTLLGGRLGGPSAYAAPVVMLFGAIGLMALLDRRDATKRISAATVAAGTALVVGWWLVALLRSGYDVRYLGAALPPLALAIGAGVAWSWHVAARRFGAVPPALGLALLCVAYASGTIAFGADWMANRSGAPGRAAAAVLGQRVQPGDAIVVVDSRSYFPIAYELSRTTGSHLLASQLWYWSSGAEPAYFGGGLIDPGRTIPSPTAARPGPLVVPGLAPGGRIWIVALTLGVHEIDGFAPLLANQLIDAEPIVVRGNGADAVIWRLEPA